ncbi:hypothetical protein SLE2022_289210 [Rubroshorea leprosula]
MIINEKNPKGVTIALLLSQPLSEFVCVWAASASPWDAPMAASVPSFRQENADTSCVFVGPKKRVRTRDRGVHVRWSTLKRVAVSWVLGWAPSGPSCWLVVG